MFENMKNKLKKRRDDRNRKFYVQMKEKIPAMSDDELRKLDMRYHDEIYMDTHVGIKTNSLMLRVRDLIEDEMRKRGLKSCDDLDEDAWFVRSHTFM